MGWWEVDGSTDELGDGPVDVFVLQMEGYNSGTQKPTFQHFLDSVAALLESDGPLVVSDPESLENLRLRARFAPPAPELVSGVPADTELQDALAYALFRIQDEYEAGLGRKPKLSEVLGTLAFPLRRNPEQFFSNAAGLQLRDFVVERG
ncbi:MAG TPA: hypothetical protein VEU33_09095 [Archangium sp.]|nr:hypothetical protein [Archangium sp.]